MPPLAIIALLLMIHPVPAAELQCTCNHGAFDAAPPVEVACAGQLYRLEAHHVQPDSPLFWTYIGICVALTLGAGLMSGLTLGLLSLDTNALTVLVRSGSTIERRRAARLLPLVRRRHWLLVTLLLANAVCMEALPIFLDAVADVVVAVLVSVTAVLIFGEIVPQAVCSRFGLAIGSFCAYLVWALMVATAPLSWPIGQLLDALFGHTHSTFYGRAQLSELIQLHGTLPSCITEGAPCAAHRSAPIRAESTARAAHADE